MEITRSRTLKAGDFTQKTKIKNINIMKLLILSKHGQIFKHQNPKSQIDESLIPKVKILKVKIPRAKILNFAKKPLLEAKKP